MQWIDVNAEAHEQQMRAHGSSRGGREPILGVCYRSECHRFRVAADDLSKPAEARLWAVWDMTGAAPMMLMSGLKSHTVAMRAGAGAAASRGLRVALRLAAIGRAMLAGMRRLMA